MATLCAFVREKTELTQRQAIPEDPGQDKVSNLSPDVRAVLAVIGRRNKAFQASVEGSEKLIDLARVSLRELIFPSRGNFSRAVFDHSDLSKSTFLGADLSSTVFTYTTLEDVIFCEATQLTETIFAYSVLNNAEFEEVEIANADFYEARLYGAYFAGADLRTAKNLTQAQLNQVYGDNSTLLPPGLRKPRRWVEKGSRDDWKDAFSAWHRGVTT